MKNLKKIIAFVIVFCISMSMVVEHAFAAPQGDNITYINEEVEEKFVQVSAGLRHTLALTAEGKLYAWGHNAYGQVGDNTTVQKNSPVFIMDHIRYIAATQWQSYAITNDGVLYAWGRNAERELGDGTTVQRIVPTRIMANVKSVAGGNRFAMALLNNGDLYIWGGNPFGALGLGTNYSAPQPVKILSNVKEIAANTNMSAALTNNGEMYFWGTVNVDSSSAYASLNTPSLLELGEDIKKIACGATSVYAINKNDELYAMGGYLNGLLLVPSDTYVYTKLNDNIKDLSVYSHALYLDVNNNLFTMGEGTYGQLGSGNKLTTYEPTKIMENIISIATGNFHSAAVSRDGELYTWGNNVEGQLGFNPTIVPEKTVPSKVIIKSNALSAPRMEMVDKEITLSVNDSASIRANVYNSNTTEATWISSDTNIATVDNYGNVTGVGAGTVQITMTTGDGLSGICQVTVTQEDDIPEIALLSLLLEVGDGTQLSVSRVLADNTKFTWSSTDEAIVTVNENGYINAISEGLIRIYAETEEESFYINVRVISGDPNTEPEEYRLAVDLQIGETAQLYLSDEAGIDWYSMDDSVATIDSNGKVTAVSEGLAIIQADFDGETYVFYIRVR